MPWTAAIEAVRDLAGQYIEDKDKLNEINKELRVLEKGIEESLLNTSTTPKTDAFVKILIAVKEVILPMLRPLGAAAMTAFGMYCHVKGIPMDGAAQAVMDGAFPAWGASRHVHKANVEKEKTRRQRKEDDDPFWCEK